MDIEPAADPKPVDHLVIAFPDAGQAEAAERELQPLGLQAAAVRRLSDQEMLRHTERALQQAGPLDRAVGQEVNLLLARRERAEQGNHWLVVHAPRSAVAAQVAEVARRHGAVRAQHYGRFVVEELIDPPGGLPQVGESPERGLDAQTPSGRETDGAQ